MVRTIKVQKKKKKKKVNKKNDISLELKKTWKTQNNFYYTQEMLRIGSIRMWCCKLLNLLTFNEVFKRKMQYG
jgi:hypothetical protein